MLITNSPELASHAEMCGVDRIFVDLEWMGKQERQGHLDTLISYHSMSDVAKVKESLSQAELLVRLNPLYDGTKAEINDALAGGADLLMLPMFRNVQELKDFCILVDGRAGVVPLVETYDAAEAMAEIVTISGVTEIYIGLNDLHLDMKLNFMFEPLANGYIDKLVSIINSAGLPFGFGGIARVGEGIIPGGQILAEHIRLCSSSVILSRTFHRKSENISYFKDNVDLRNELDKLNKEGNKLKARSTEQIAADHRMFQNVVAEIVKVKKI